MGQPLRKSNKSSELSSERVRNKNGEKVAELNIEANENETEEAFLDKTEKELEREFGKGKPLEVHMRDIRALRAFRNAFPSLKHADPENLNIYVIHPDFNVAITRAFGLTSSEHVTLLADSKGERRMLEKKEYDVVKGHAERKQLPEKQDVVVGMDDSVRPTSRLLKNVAPGGWILWPISSANALRGMGKYSCMGLLERDSASPSVKDIDDDFWKKAEIETDDELKNAPEEEGIVTWKEAESAVKEAFGTTRDVVKNYKRLIELAEEQNKSAIENGATEVMCTIERSGSTVEVRVHLVLPLREEEFRSRENDLVIFKKRGFA